MAAATGLHAGYTPASVLSAVAGAFVCVAVHGLVRWFFATRPLAWFSLPVATAPFWIVAGLIVAVVG